jgi:hypothetical protein
MEKHLTPRQKMVHVDMAYFDYVKLSIINKYLHDCYDPCNSPSFNFFWSYCRDFFCISLTCHSTYPTLGEALLPLTGRLCCQCSLPSLTLGATSAEPLSPPSFGPPPPSTPRPPSWLSSSYEFNGTGGGRMEACNKMRQHQMICGSVGWNRSDGHRCGRRGRIM